MTGESPQRDRWLIDAAIRSRRDFMRSAVSAGAALVGGASFVKGDNAMAQNPSLPVRGEYLIRRGFVMTMDAALGDLPRADVHIRDGSIVAVADDIEAPNAAPIDGTDMIVMPGLVETHWHIWTTMLRSMSGDVPEHGYFPTSRGIGAHYLASDMYHSARLALAEAAFGGITFVHDWCHNVRAPEYARAAVRALGESGLRARFSYGSAAGQAGDTLLDWDDIAALQREWSSLADDGRLKLGMAWRGAGTDASLQDYRRARELGLPVSVHVNNYQSAAGGIAAIAAADMLGPHVQLIHAIWSTPEELAAVAASGASLSLSPFTELRIGFGFPMTAEYLAAGVRIGLSIDTPALSGSADMFGVMKLIQNVENARALDEFRLPARRVLELATIEGARSMGVADVTGSLTPGKRADVIMVDTRQVNLGVFTDPAHMLVEAAQPANVDTVIADGRVLKRGGRLQHVDTSVIVDEARAASTAARARANWW
jgi:cytosine/adenosine deaminase-related metal-dependent hydrolase